MYIRDVPALYNIWPILLKFGNCLLSEIPWTKLFAEIIQQYLTPFGDLPQILDFWAPKNFLFLLRCGRASFGKHFKPIFNFLAHLVLCFFYSLMCFFSYGMLAYVDFTFSLLDITIWSKFAQNQIGRKFTSLTSACDLVLHSSCFQILNKDNTFAVYVFMMVF